MTIHPIRLSISNAYLVKGQVNVLIDTGSPGEGKKIIRALSRLGVALSDLALIIHTHGHSDHCGSTRELTDVHPVPTAIHSGDLQMAESGKNGPITTTTLFSRMLVPFVDKPFHPFKPDFLLDQMNDLSSLGIRDNVLHTPGHSEGSISLVFETGDIIIGDLLMGGFLGGALFPRRPGYHYFIQDKQKLLQSIEAVLALKGGLRFWTGHGGPLDRNETLRWYHTEIKRK